VLDHGGPHAAVGDETGRSGAHSFVLDGGAAMTTQLWNPAGRLTPWVLFDLERMAWVVEQRSDELTPDERTLLQEVAARFARAATFPTGEGPG
jgi:hypothetical protein